MFGSRKVRKAVLVSLLAVWVAVWAPAGQAWALGVSSASAGKADGDRSAIVATVGAGIVITRSELEQAMARYKEANGKDKLTKAEIAGLLEDLIRRRLLLESEAVKAYRKDPVIVAKVRDYEDTLIVARWARDKIRSKVQVSPEEVRAYYEKNRAQFRTPPKVQASYILLRTRDEAEAVQKKLQEGGDFAQLAKQYSIDLPTGQKGGLIGTISESKNPSELGKVLFLLAPGETSGIISTKAGYAIFKADKIEPPGFQPYDLVCNKIRDQLFREKARDAFKQIVENLEKNAGIKIFQKRLAAIEQTADSATAPEEEKSAASTRVMAGK